MSENTNTFIKLYHNVLCDERLTPTEKIVYSALLGYQENAGSVFPSNAYLAEMLGMSEISVKRSTKKLESLGLITKTRRFNKSNLVTVNKLEVSKCTLQTYQNDTSRGIKMTSYKNRDKNREKISSKDESQNQVADAPVTGMNSMVMEGTDEKQNNLSDKKHCLESNLNKLDVDKATSHTVIKEVVTGSSAPAHGIPAEDDEPLDDDEYSSEPIHYF
ncbi:helix-turn-helix domain-containing protein [Enterobacter bugandensis]|uniref:helix-turn-helix domain-containing protein n=1 Tax=Enterobacter bugandensis TaxID=881260 RepID=UPI002075BB4C|nr:helix-turn-helix domain-containing protein [Enterobacter bugandensis]MCM7468117.1 helix-turn-helix domain-containing protein [Enterobacter bugandensis]